MRSKMLSCAVMIMLSAINTSCDKQDDNAASSAAVDSMAAESATQSACDGPAVNGQEVNADSRFIPPVPSPSRPDETAEADHAAPTTQKASAPVRVVPFRTPDGGLHFDDAEGPPLFAQTFGLDLEKKVSGPAGGQVRLQIEGFPVPVALSIGSLTSAGGTKMSAIYANTLWDLREVHDVLLGVLFTTKGKRLCTIRLRHEAGGELLLSPDYLASTPGLEAADKNGPFATVHFYWAEGAPGLPADARLVVKRNGREVKSLVVDGAERTTLIFAGVSREYDVVEWAVKAADGTTLCDGVLGFPVSAVSPDLVEYLITVPQVDQGPKNTGAAE